MRDWRTDAGLSPVVKYTRRFAIFPTKCNGDVSVWFKFYYKRYTVWKSNYGNKVYDYEDEYSHTDFDYNLTEDEYIIRKLTETP